MATLWWIGATANGDVNVAGNWSYYGPGGYQAGYTALVPATNIPKYNDYITFDKFIPAGTVYPLYAPVGDMNGICGPVGATAAQYFKEVKVNQGYPKTLGGSTAFAFRTSSLIISRGVTGSLANDYSNSHYIHLRDCSGVTKINAIIRLDSTLKENYIISGVAGQLNIGAINTPAPDRLPFANIYLNNLELQGRTWTSAEFSNPINLAYSNAAIKSDERNVLFDNRPTQTAQVFIYVYPTTTIVNNIYLEGREKLVVFRGFNLNSNGVYLIQQNAQGLGSYAQIEFRSDANSSFTGTGGDYATRSYIYELHMRGDAGVEDGNNAYLPKAILDHGVDINQLYFTGTGQITTNYEQQGDAPRIQRGRVNFAASGAVDDPNLYPKMGLYSDIDNISFGAAGRFIWDNTPSVYGVTNILRSNTRGLWAYKITPLFGE